MTLGGGVAPGVGHAVDTCSGVKHMCRNRRNEARPMSRQWCGAAHHNDAQGAPNAPVGPRAASASVCFPRFPPPVARVPQIPGPVPVRVCGVKAGEGPGGGGRGPLPSLRSPGAADGRSLPPSHMPHAAIPPHSHSLCAARLCVWVCVHCVQCMCGYVCVGGSRKVCMGAGVCVCLRVGSLHLASASLLHVCSVVLTVCVRCVCVCVSPFLLPAAHCSPLP